MSLENEDLKKEVQVVINSLKELLVTYTGDKVKPVDGIVTLQMVLEVLADEFPEVVLALAEENYLRGYQECTNDREK